MLVKVSVRRHEDPGHWRLPVGRGKFCNSSPGRWRKAGCHRRRDKATLSQMIVHENRGVGKRKQVNKLKSRSPKAMDAQK